MDSLMSGSCLSKALTRVDLPAPEGATTMNRLPEVGFFVGIAVLLGWWLVAGYAQLTRQERHYSSKAAPFQRALRDRLIPGSAPARASGRSVISVPSKRRPVLSWLLWSRLYWLRD